MNRAQELYNNLMRLVDTNEAFYHVDHNINGVLYRVFTYRLASYTDFLEPDALECRGHMFRVDGDDVELVSLPFEKFFNLNENPMTMDLDLSQVEYIHEKRDGSLITTYLHEDEVRLKSKTALASDQALGAMRVMNNDYNLKLMVETAVIKHDSTVIFEYTSPENRIVLPYQTDELTVLGCRNNRTGKHWGIKGLTELFGDYMVKDHTHEAENPEQFIANIPHMTGIEGFVIKLPYGPRIKVKTEEYFSLHRAKDSIQSNRRLFEVAVRGATDDLRSMFHDDQYTLDRITEMEKIAGHAMNSMVHSVENFHKENKKLDRKSYAIKGQKELDRMSFNCAMRMYTGGIPDYEEILVKNFKQFIEDNDEQVDN